MKIGEYIKKIREEKNILINQLSLYSGVSEAHISRIENGLRSPSPKVLKKLSIGLGYPYEDLMKVAGYIEPDDKSNNIYSKEEAEKLSDEFIKILIDEGLIEEGQELTPEEREMYLDIFKQSIKLAKKLKNRP